MQQHDVLMTGPATAQNPRRVNEDAARAPVDPTSIPTATRTDCIDLDVTEDCNLACIYCFKGEMFSRHMSLLMMKKALDWLLLGSGTLETVNVNFMGGEPTMRWKQIKEFVPWARRHGASRGKLVKFSMTSNLTLWTDEIRRFVDDYGFGVLMSIDGCPAVQDAQRPSKNGKRYSEIVEFWARSMLKTRPASTARSTIHPKFADRFFESMHYLESIGFSEAAVSLSNYADWTIDNLNILRDQVFMTVDLVERTLCQGGKFNLTVFRYYIGKLIHLRCQGLDAEIKFHHQPCGAGKNYLMVDYTGDVWPCHRFDGADTDAGAKGQFRLGNILQPGFNDELQRAFINFDHKTDHKLACNTCPVNPVCGGYCPAANLSETHSIYTPHDTFCYWSRLMYDAAKDLYSRCKIRGGDVFNRLVESAMTADNDGQK